MVEKVTRRSDKTAKKGYCKSRNIEEWRKDKKPL